MAVTPNVTDEAPSSARLPRTLMDGIRRPFVRFMRIETGAAGVLLFATICALLLANSPWSLPFEAFWETQAGFHLGALDYERSLREWINDGWMTLFFFVVALELKREIVFGELRRPRAAALSISAALGGMVVPAAAYLAFRSGEADASGWGTVVATDTAFLLGCLALLGSGIPRSLRVFVLSLAIFDDIGAILVIALGYSEGIHWPPLILAGASLVLLRGLSMIGVRSFAPFTLVAIAIWMAIDASGIHPTVTGVLVGLMTPARRWVSDTRLYAILGQVVAHPTGDENSHATADRETLRLAELAARETLSPVERLELMLHPWVAFGVMPLFALANAGMELGLEGANPGMVMAIVAGFVLGKPVGILAFSWLALRAGVADRPAELTWGRLTGGAMLAGIGFTMALFIAHLAFADGLLESAKLGILLSSCLAAVLGMTVLAIAARAAPAPR